MTRQIEKLRSYRLKRIRGYKTKDLSAFAMPYLEEGRESSLSPDGEVASLMPPRDQVMSVEARRVAGDMAQYRAGRQLSAPPKMEIKQVYGRPTTPQDKPDKTSPKSPSNKKRKYTVPLTSKGKRADIAEEKEALVSHVWLCIAFLDNTEEK
ncbi:PREDICTED: uncharacterized protein LOC109461814 isoform X3 [Branchiostoma belcheri]|uniref:Uncharacterized protein LOC109461814 isoform X3 n=1 Tax=Branchiostoma belcheri TaxID=7741 RepID=A0A6P4XT27_BRABE|nr:PREDICTED: uncharacterized protein LOC109461814 isoform X3 [Branchiostoma belcheri]